MLMVWHWPVFPAGTHSSVGYKDAAPIRPTVDGDQQGPQFYRDFPDRLSGATHTGGAGDDQQAGQQEVGDLNPAQTPLLNRLTS